MTLAMCGSMDACLSASAAASSRTSPLTQTMAFSLAAITSSGAQEQVHSAANWASCGTTRSRQSLGKTLVQASATYSCGVACTPMRTHPGSRRGKSTPRERKSPGLSTAEVGGRLMPSMSNSRPKLPSSLSPWQPQEGNQWAHSQSSEIWP
eukprot:3143221-Amphidinium_carterae.3